MKQHLTLALASLAFFASTAQAQSTAPLKIGLMLPYSGTYAALGNAIENGFRLYLKEQGDTLGGRTVEFVKLDDASDPAKATENVGKLIRRDKVDVLIGSVHSGVAMAMARAAKESNTLMIVPNAGADAVTGPLCAPNIFRTSFSNWQSSWPMGVVAAKEQGKKTAITITWKYAAGQEMTNAFKEGFEKEGGKVLKQLTLPFPNVEFQALLTEIASAKPDAVFAFFAGGGAVKFVTDWHAAGLGSNITLYGPGFLTDGTLQAQGAAAQGLFTTLHYGDGLDVAKDKTFRAAYSSAYPMVPDVYAVQGYDAAQILHVGLQAVQGDISKKAEIAAAIESATFDSPRGSFTMSAAHNPVQNVYLRQVQGNANKVVGIATPALADPARGCKM